MPLTLSEVPAAQSLLGLNLMGFDIAHLGFYRWLVEHGQDPEFRNTPRDLQSASSLTKQPERTAER